MIVRSRSVSYESKMVTLSGIARTLEPDRYGVSLCLEVLAWIAADPQQRHQRAATLVGAADSLQTDIGASITSYGHLVGFHLVCERQIHDALGEVPFTEAFHHGQDLTYEDDRLCPRRAALLPAGAAQGRADPADPPRTTGRRPHRRRAEQQGHRR
jgi:hypothetical protein